MSLKISPQVRSIVLVVLVLTSSAYADEVTRWNSSTGKAAIAACMAPEIPNDNSIHLSRLYAMVHIAIHDAVNAIDRQSRPYVFDVRAERWASVEAAVAASARDVLVHVIDKLPSPVPPECITAGVASVEADYQVALAAIRNGLAKSKGIEIGQAAAAAILEHRASDGSDFPILNFDYPQGTEPGEYRFTPGAPFAAGTEWGNVTPFVLNDGSQYRPPQPFEVRSRRYLADFDEVKTLGGDGVTTPSTRTSEQTEIALFWLETSPTQWNRLALAVSASRGLSLWENARLLGLLNLALADGYIAGFNAKYHYNFWRPVTAIQTADTDGNPNTPTDLTWTPLRSTPAIPEHPSTHSVAGGAAAEVLRQFFGTDDIAFSVCSLTLPEGSTCNDAAPVLRHYDSFSEAEEENGLSRILVGFHFRHAVASGIQQGRKVANRAVNLFLRPAH